MPAHAYWNMASLSRRNRPQMSWFLDKYSFQTTAVVTSTTRPDSHPKVENNTVTIIMYPSPFEKKLNSAPCSIFGKRVIPKDKVAWNGGSI